MSRDIGDTDLGLGPRGLPLPTYLIPGGGRRCSMMSVPRSSKTMSPVGS